MPTPVTPDIQRSRAWHAECSFAPAVLTSTSPRHLDVCPNVTALRVVQDGGADDLVLDPRAVYTFGRTDRAEVVLHNASVSRLHAMMYANGGTWLIKDLGSANGTFVYRLDDYERHVRTGGKLPAERLPENVERVLHPGEGVIFGTRRARIEARATLPDAPTPPPAVRGILDYPTLAPRSGSMLLPVSSPSSKTASDGPARTRR